MPRIASGDLRAGKWNGVGHTHEYAKLFCPPRLAECWAGDTPASSRPSSDHGRDLPGSHRLGKPKLTR